MAPVSRGRAHSHCFSHGSLLPALDMLTLAPLLTDSGNMGQDLAEFLVSTLSLIPRLLREVERLRLQPKEREIWQRALKPKSKHYPQPHLTAHPQVRDEAQAELLALGCARILALLSISTTHTLGKTDFLKNLPKSTCLTLGACLWHHSCLWVGEADCTIHQLRKWSSSSCDLSKVAGRV